MLTEKQRKNLLSQAEDMEACGWKDDAQALRELLACRPDAQADEPVAYEFQHDETGRTTFVDPWQVEQGFAANNPRWQLIGPVFRHARAAAPSPDREQMGEAEFLGCISNWPLHDENCAEASPSREGRGGPLFRDLKTDEEKANFFLSGRGYATGVIARAIQNDVAMAYQRCAGYAKELAARAQPGLTDEQREAIEWAADRAASYARPVEGETTMMKYARVLRALLAKGE